MKASSCSLNALPRLFQTTKSHKAKHSLLANSIRFYTDASGTTYSGGGGKIPDIFSNTWRRFSESWAPPHCRARVGRVWNNVWGAWSAAKAVHLFCWGRSATGCRGMSGYQQWKCNSLVHFYDDDATWLNAATSTLGRGRRCSVFLHMEVIKQTGKSDTWGPVGPFHERTSAISKWDTLCAHIIQCDERVCVCVCTGWAGDLQTPSLP